MGMPYSQRICIYKNAEQIYGAENQITVAMEECAELTQALSKFLRGDRNEASMQHIAEEMADVRIVLEQLEMIFGNYIEVDEWQQRKLNRLKSRLYAESVLQCRK